MISQFIDTFTVNTIFLYKNPAVFTGDFSDLMGVILGVYILKVAIAALDTPLCYLGVWYVKRLTGVKGEPTGKTILQSFSVTRHPVTVFGKARSALQQFIAVR